MEKKAEHTPTVCSLPCGLGREANVSFDRGRKSCPCATPWL